MATPFINIFDEFLTREIDSDRILAYTVDYRFKLLSSYLLAGREFFRDIVYSNIDTKLNKAEDCTEFQREVYNYTATETTFSQKLIPAPPIGASFLILVNKIETDNYSYDEVTETITIQGLSETSDIYISAYKNGQFNQTLSLTEQGLFIRLMSLFWMRDKINTDKLLCQKVYGKDWGMYSQANHLQALQERYKTEYDNIYSDIIAYSYKNSPEKLMNLGGSFYV